MIFLNKYYIRNIIRFIYILLGIGDWGLGIGDWGLGIGDWAQTPKPKNPNPNPQVLF